MTRWAVERDAQLRGLRVEVVAGGIDPETRDTEASPLREAGDGSV